ncbi:MAG: ribonuclease III [Thermodesulfobacteriota bacterium]
MRDKLDNLTGKLGYSFRNRELIEEAFRHSSYVNEAGVPTLRDNERLEFLGDAVLDLSISHLLMDRFKEAREGELSKLRAMMVDERSLSRIALKLNLGEFLLLGCGEERTNGRQKPSILANAVEALIGAVYLDGGFARTDEIVRRLFAGTAREVELEASSRDHKSLMQEYTQRRYETRPEYVLLGESGPPHDRVFRMALRLHGRVLAEGSGRSKKAAEQEVARKAYQCLTKDMPEP